MRKFLLLLLLLPLSVSIAHAQGSGYLGKHFILSYEPRLGLNVFFINAQKGYGFQNAFKADYILGRHITLGGEFALMGLTSDKDAAAGWPGVKMKSTEYGLNLTMYGGDNSNTPLAPIGNYFRVRVYAYNYSMDDPKGITWGVDDVDNYLTKPATAKVSGIGLTLGVGHSTVIKDAVVLDLGFDFNLLPALPWMLETDPELLGITGDPSEQYLQREMMAATYFKLKVGVGGLLF